MKCCTCKAREARAGQRNCRECHAVAQKAYREHLMRSAETRARQAGLEEGFMQAYKFLREFVGERTVSGFEAAHQLRKRFPATARS